MAKPSVSAGGGFPAIFYVFKKGFQVGNPLALYRRLRSRNACKTCALGMGGQKGGMVNEQGHFPEVCKKSVQAQAGDMAKTISEEVLCRTPIDELMKLSSRECEELGRLVFPVVAEPGDTHFRRISWDEAFHRASEALRKADPQEVFFYSSGRSSNEAAFLFQLVARAFGTPNIHNCSFYCHSASSVALPMIYGSGTSSVILDDIDQADLALIVGANPASNHPRLIRNLVHLRRRGGKVIVINPLKELGLVRFKVPSDWKSLLFGSRISDLYLQPHVGTDIALLKALLKALVERGALDQEFISAYTTGFEAVLKDLETCSVDALLTVCGVERRAFEEAVEILAASKRGIFLWAMGLTHHVHGVDNILALGNLALARGFLGKRGAGLMPIRGHSNVQGVSTCGMTPGLKKAFSDKLTELYDIKIPEDPGQDTYESMQAAHAGKVKVALLLGGNLFSSNPDRLWAQEAMRKIGLTVSITTKLNEGHFWGRGQGALLLPVLARDEEAQATTQESMFNYVRLSEGGTQSVAGDLRSEVDVIASLAERILPPKGFPWSSLRSHQKLREEIAKVVPGFSPIAQMGETKTEFQIVGRTFHEPRFSTTHGRAHFYVTPVPQPQGQPHQFRLMTLRSEGQFNTVVYEEEDLYRGNKRRDVVMMNSQDAQGLRLREGDRVGVRTEVGELQVSVAFVDLPPGNLAMYYPEANALVPRRLDPRSKTPAFKMVLAEIVASPR